MQLIPTCCTLPHTHWHFIQLSSCATTTPAPHPVLHSLPYLDEIGGMGGLLPFDMPSIHLHHAFALPLHCLLWTGQVLILPCLGACYTLLCPNFLIHSTCLVWRFACHSAPPFFLPPLPPHTYHHTHHLCTHPIIHLIHLSSWIIPFIIYLFQDYLTFQIIYYLLF